MRLLVKISLCCIILFVGFLISYTSSVYFNPDFTKGYLINKEEIFKGVFSVGFYIHIIFAPIILLLGTSLIFFRLEKYKKLHRSLGYNYVFISLLITFSGIVLSFYAFGGITSKINFLFLSSLFGWFVFKAFLAIRQRKIIVHRKFMTRSYILVLSAVNLRLLSFIFINVLNWYGEVMYTTIGILSWVPFILLYEVNLYLKSRGLKLT